MRTKIYANIAFLIAANFFCWQAFALNSKSFRFCTNHNFKVTPFRIDLYDIYFCNNEAQKLSYPNIWDKQFALVINYNKNISKQRLVEASIQQIKKHNQLTETDSQNIVKKLSEIFPEVKKGDQISAAYFQGIITLEHNQKRIGIISEPIFTKQFINIWLNPQNEFKEMRFDLVNYEK
jgi:hypothetical protein